MQTSSSGRVSRGTTTSCNSPPEPARARLIAALAGTEVRLRRERHPLHACWMFTRGCFVGIWEGLAKVARPGKAALHAGIWASGAGWLALLLWAPQGPWLVLPPPVIASLMYALAGLDDEPSPRLPVAETPQNPAPAERAPVEDTFWSDVVGIPLDDWAGARTTAELCELIARRERGEFEQRPVQDEPCPPGCERVEIRTLNELVTVLHNHRALHWQGQITS